MLQLDVVLTRQRKAQADTPVNVSYEIVWSGIKIKSVVMNGKEILKYLNEGYIEEMTDQINLHEEQCLEEVEEGWIYNLGEW